MPYFTDFIGKLNRINRINQTEMLNNIFQIGRVKIYVEDLIKFEQLFKGIDGTGKRLDAIGGGYADSTIIKKRRKGQPIDRVTLFDEGDYYESIFMISPSGNETDIIIESEPEVADGYDLRQDWGSNLTELTAPNKKKLAFEIVKPLIIQSFLNTWSGKTL